MPPPPPLPCQANLRAVRKAQVKRILAVSARAKEREAAREGTAAATAAEGGDEGEGEGEGEAAAGEDTDGAAEAKQSAAQRAMSSRYGK